MKFMPKFGYHASHEQFTPAELVRYARLAEEAGFEAVMSSEHITPWSVRQGQSGMAWPWLGAAMQATALPFGSLAIPGGWRYHPVIVAHAFATLGQMFPGRLPWIAVGSGEYANEHVVGSFWPGKRERNARMKEAADTMRALWQGETVTRQGGFIEVDEAKLWTLPEIPPRLYGAALTEETARWLGSWADGLITVNKPPEKLQALLNAFREGGGEGKPLVLQVHLSWAEEEETALHAAHDQWRTNIIGSDGLADFRTVEEFERAAADITPEQMREHVLISSNTEQHISWLSEYIAMGFDEIYLHAVGRNQETFLTHWGSHVLPALKAKG
jgi:probable non-F420 flavinoid oxidoreductase